MNVVNEERRTPPRTLWPWMGPKSARSMRRIDPWRRRGLVAQAPHHGFEHHLAECVPPRNGGRFALWTWRRLVGLRAPGTAVQFSRADRKNLRGSAAVEGDARCSRCRWRSVQSRFSFHSRPGDKRRPRRGFQRGEHRSRAPSRLGTNSIAITRRYTGNSIKEASFTLAAGHVFVLTSPHGYRRQRRSRDGPRGLLAPAPSPRSGRDYESRCVRVGGRRVGGCSGSRPCIRSHESRCVRIERQRMGGSCETGLRNRDHES